MTNISYRPIGQSGNALTQLGNEAADNLLSRLFSSQTEVRFPPGQLIEEREKISNSILAGAGNHHGVKLEKAHTVFFGEAGTVVDRIATFRNHAVISNIHFKQLNDESNKNQLVIVDPVATATSSKPVKILFRNCIFERRYNAPSGTGASNELCFVLIKEFSKVVFDGCVFRSNLESGAMNGTGTAVLSQNALATDVQIASGVNLSTHTHTNVTIAGPEI